MLEFDELSAIDDFRFRYRLPSRAAAVRELMKRGLASEPTGATARHSRSEDFGVLNTANGSGFKKSDES